MPWWEVCSYTVWGVSWFLLYRYMSAPNAAFDDKLITAVVSGFLALWAPMILMVCLGQLIAFLAVDLAMVAAPFVWSTKLLKIIWNAASGQRRLKHRPY